MHQSLVSVIILAYRQPAFLNEALACVAAQTHRNIEILIVDDESGDEFTAQYQLPENARLLINPQRLQCAAMSRNAAIRLAKGEFIALLDQDDIWLPEKLERQLAAFKKEPAALMHFTDILRVDENLKPLETQDEWGGTSGDFLRNLIRRQRQHVICCSSVMIPRQTFDLVGLFDENIRCSADYDMWLRIAAAGKVLGEKRRLTLYRQHAAQWSKSSLAALQGEAAVLEKALGWATKTRPDLRGLMHKRLARYLRQAGRIKLDAGEESDARDLFRRSAKLWPWSPKIYGLLWRARRARRVNPARSPA